MPLPFALPLPATGRLLAYAAVAGALAVVGWQWHARGQRIAALQTAAGQLSAQHAQCSAQRDALDQAVADLRAAGAADRAARAGAEAAAAQVSAQAERRVRAALTAHVPPECPAAMDWLGEQGRAMARQWQQEES